MSHFHVSTRFARPGLFAFALLAGTSSVALAQSTDALKGSGSVVVSTWGGSYTDAQIKAFFAPFTEKTGIEVVTTGTPNAAKLQLMHKSGNVEWDVVDAEAQMMYSAVADGALAPIDYDLVYKVTPREDLIPTNLKEFGFPSISFGWVMAWNTDKVQGSPEMGWADFWNTEKFPGRRALYAQPKPLLEVALLADGVEPDKLYPLDLDRAFAKLDEIKSKVDVWYEDLGQADVLLRNGEVDMMLTSNGRAHAAKQEGLKVDFTFNQGAWEQGYWVVPANSPNAENAQKLIAWTSQPEGQAEFAAAFGYGGPNLSSYKMIDAGVLAGLPTAPENLPKQVAVEGEWWTQNLDEVNRRWLEWYTQAN